MKLPTRRTLLMVAAGLAAAAGLAWMLRPVPVPVEIAAVGRGPIEVWVEDQGRTRVREVYVVSAPLAGRTVRQTLHAGDRVKAGQAVVLIQPADPPLIDDRTRRTFQADARAAEAAVALAQADLQRAQAELVFASSQWDRAQALARSGTMAAQAVEQRRMTRDTASAGVATARAALAVRSRELEAARSRLVEPNAQSAARCCVTVRAPVSGRVLRVIRESEQVVQAGEPILQIGDAGDMDVVIELLSTDATLVRPGAVARIEGWGGASLPARVNRIEPAGFTKVSALGVEEQRVLAYLDFTGPEQERLGLGHDYRVTARIRVWSTDSAVHLPTSALFRSGADWAVYRIQEGRARLVKVQIGQRNEDIAEITGGLAVGDRVVAYPGDRLSDGARIQERR